MMRILILIIMLLPCSLGMYASAIDSLLSVLDKTIVMRRQYEEEKERYISLIKDELKQGRLTDMERYLIQNRLFAEYNSYISDSALHYINENILIATRLNNRQWINSSILNKVHILNTCLLYTSIKHYLAASEMYSVAKGTREEIYEFMMGDLDDEVTKYLPQRSVTQQGRVCRDAAKLLRAKIILFHRDETKYQVALNDMKEIITSGRYQLNPDYQNLWVKDGEWCAESIFEVCYAGNNSGEGFGLARSLGGRNIVDPRSAEQGGLGEGYGQNTMPSTVYNMFKEGDTRREGTVIVYADEAKKVAEMVAKGELPAGSAFQVSDQQENYEGLGHYKIHPRKETTSTVNPTDNYYNSWRIYRYACLLYTSRC